jgi:predicted  nucleic acid-binding Zn-ribbon protein
MNDQILQIEARLTQVIEQNTTMNSSMNTLTNNVTSITTTLTGHHVRMVQMQNNYETTNQSLNNRITNQQDDIANIYSILNNLQKINFNTQTPTDLRQNKKSKHHTPIHLCKDIRENTATDIFTTQNNTTKNNTEQITTSEPSNATEENNDFNHSSPYSYTESPTMEQTSHILFANSNLPETEQNETIIFSSTDITPRKLEQNYNDNSDAMSDDDSIEKDLGTLYPGHDT